MLRPIPSAITVALSCLLAFATAVPSASRRLEFLDPGSPAAQTSSHDSASVTNATAFAITYGYPLIQFASTLDSLLATDGANAVISETVPATVDSAAVIRPNEDTLYSKIAIDLSHADVVLTVPEVKDDRYYVFAFYDLWSNNFANIGSVTCSLPGQYLLRQTNDPHKVGFEPDYGGGDYVGFINFPTVYGLSLPRVELKNLDSDVAKVNAIQEKIKVKTVPRAGCTKTPRLTPELLGGSAVSSLGGASTGGLNKTRVHDLLQLTAELFPYNKPLNKTEAQQVEKMLSVAGLSQGEYSPPKAVNYTAANAMINSNLLSIAKQIEPFGHAWVDFKPAASGNFHTHYVVRSFIAQTAYLQMTQEQALYPEWIGAGITGLSLKANESYVFTFSGKPPVSGFWSLTAYNESSYLIDNPLDRYSIGDRSNMTYPDGQGVYGGDTTTHSNSRKRSEPFSILVQPADMKPNANWTSNWLPAPAGGGNFTVNLRLYGPNEQVKAGGSYEYPIVTKQAAMLSSLYE